MDGGMEESELFFLISGVVWTILVLLAMLF